MHYALYDKTAVCRTGIVIALAAGLFAAPISSVRALTRIEELQSNIAEKNEEIESLDREIKRLDAELDTVAKEKQSLAGAIKEIDVARRKIATDLSSTQTKIERTDLVINRLELTIAENEAAISAARTRLESALRGLSREEEVNPIEVMLSNGRWSAVWNSIAALERIQDKIQLNLAGLAAAHSALESDQLSQSREKQTLLGLKGELGDKKRLADSARSSKQRLLAETKSLETEYQKLIAENLAKKRAFEQELFSLESELRFTLDPTSIPESGKGVLSWPVPNPFVTQTFGDTAFAAANRGVYNGKGHNGIDLRAGIGTPVSSAASGVVLGAGDTDPTCRGASYGKWVLVRHENGLSTLYAHLSIISVNSGDILERGQVIGYSGKTGYSTGPHLHFTVYASEAVKIGQLKSKLRGCGTYTIPLAALNGYLDPLLYL